MYNKKKIIAILAGISVSLLVTACDSDNSQNSDVSVRTAKGDEKLYKTLKVLNDTPNSISKVVIKDGNAKVLKEFSSVIDPGSYDSFNPGMNLNANMIIEIYDGKGDLVSGGTLADNIVFDGGNEYRIYNNNYTLGKYLVANYLANHKNVSRQSVLDKLGSLFGLSGYADQVYAVLALYMDKSGSDANSDESLSKLDSIINGKVDTSSRVDSSLLTQVKPVGAYLGQFDKPQKLSSQGAQTKGLQATGYQTFLFDKTYSSDSPIYQKALKVCGEQYNKDTQPSLFGKCAKNAQDTSWGKLSKYANDPDTIASSTFPKMAPQVMGLLKASGVDVTGVCPIPKSGKGRGIFSSVMSIASTVASFAGPVYSGLVGGVTSIVGAICPNATAAAGGAASLLPYLDQQFNKLNSKLDGLTSSMKEVKETTYYTADTLDAFISNTNLKDYNNARSRLLAKINGISNDYNNYMGVFDGNAHKFLRTENLLLPQASDGGNQFSPEFWSKDNAFSSMSQYFDAGGYLASSDDGEQKLPAFLCSSQQTCPANGYVLSTINGKKVNSLVNKLYTDLSTLTDLEEYKDYLSNVNAICGSSDKLSSLEGRTSNFAAYNVTCTLDVANVTNLINTWAIKLSFQLRDLEFMLYRNDIEVQGFRKLNLGTVKTRLSTIGLVSLPGNPVPTISDNGQITSDPIIDMRDQVLLKNSQAIMALYQNNNGILTPKIFSDIRPAKQIEMVKNGCGKISAIPDANDPEKSNYLYRLNVTNLAKSDSAHSDLSRATLNCNHPVVRDNPLSYPDLAFPLEKYFAPLVQGRAYELYLRNPYDTIADFMNAYYSNLSYADKDNPNLIHRGDEYKDGYVPEEFYSNIDSKTTWYYNKNYLFHGGDFVDYKGKNNDPYIPDDYLFNYTSSDPVLVSFNDVEIDIEDSNRANTQTSVMMPSMLRNWYDLQALSLTSNLIDHPIDKDSAINIAQTRSWMNNKDIGACSFKNSRGQLDSSYTKLRDYWLARGGAIGCSDVSEANDRYNRGDKSRLSIGNTSDHGLLFTTIAPRYFPADRSDDDLLALDYQRVIASYIDKNGFVHLYSINMDYSMAYYLNPVRYTRNKWAIYTQLSVSCMQDSSCKVVNDGVKNGIIFSNGDGSTSMLNTPLGGIRIDPASGKGTTYPQNGSVSITAN